MKMLTVKEVWSKGLCRSSRIKWLSNSIELAWRNMRFITELESLGLPTYWVGTWWTGVESFRSKESVTSMRTLVYTRW